MNELTDMLTLLASRDFSYKNKSLQEQLANNNLKDLVDKISQIESPIIYSRFINLMQYKIDVSQIDEKRDKYIKDLLFHKINFDSNTFVFFDYYEKIVFTPDEKESIQDAIKKNRLDVVLQDIANKWLKEYIIYYFFRDNYYNFIVNLNQMLKYLRNIKINLIESEHMSFYRECYDLDKLSFNAKLKFFKENYHKKNIQSMFYDDIRRVKNHSYQNLVNSLLKLNRESGLYNEKLSQKFHHTVYYLNGEDFKGLIRWIKPNNGRDEEEYSKYVYSRKDKDYYSFSYISNRNIGSIGRHGNGYTLLYSDINPSYITHVYHDDAGSSYLVKEKHFITEKFNEIHTPDSLIGDTKYYNEIVIKKEENGIKPSALVCFDEIKDEELVFAKQYVLPIVLINSMKYYQNDDYTDFDEYDTYSI